MKHYIERIIGSIPAEYPRGYSATIGVIFGYSATIGKMCGYSTTIGGGKVFKQSFWLAFLLIYTC